MLVFTRWLLLLIISVIETQQITETQQTTGEEREAKHFIDFKEFSPARIWTRASIPKPFHYNYDYRPSHAYSQPYFSLNNIFRKIVGWKKKPLYKPYYKPYIFLKPLKTTTTTTTKPPVLPCECGIRNPARKIVGGDETGINEYPWVVALCEKSPCNQENQICGGSLINDYYVLTAAHCVEDESSNIVDTLIVSLGDHDLNSADETSSIEMESTEFVIHPDYSLNGFLNDLALIKLPTKPLLSNTIRPICLPQNDDNTYAGDLAIASGWGDTTFGGESSNVLMDVSVAALNNEACSNVYPEYGEIPPTQICAGGMGEDSCQGDSGGPLFTEIGDNKYELIGAVSYGIGCAAQPGVYQRISKYLDWIAENTPGALYCASK